MQKNKRKRFVSVFAILCILLLVIFLLNICIGSVKISLSELKDCLFGVNTDKVWYRIVWDIRFPRAVAVSLLGGGLGLAGFLLQTFFRNPIAGPFTLGISSGAKMIVALVLIFMVGSSKQVSSAMLIFSAFIGAMISMGFVLLMSLRVKKMSMLIVSGVMIGYICSAVTDFIVTFAEDAEIVNLHNWSKGSFSGMTWTNVKAITVVIAVSFLLVFLLSKPLGAYQLGENYAKNMGVNIIGLRITMVILSSVIAGCIVAYAGPVSFVGVAVPHIVKRMLKTMNPMVMIPACFLGGSVFCLFCDLIARTVFAPTELSISTVTAIFGAPVVLWVMAIRKKEASL